MLSIKNLSKHFGTHKVLDSINIKIAKGKVLAVIGPSGSGKSLLLRCIAGLEAFDEGIVEISSKAPYSVGMVFQNFNLFNNKTILENLMYPQLKVLKRPHKEAERIAMKFLSKMGLLSVAQKYHAALSGGQKQRVAIARTLCMHPAIILFDEPTSSLDPENVREVLETIKELVHTEITVVIVTHEMLFAKEISDQVIFLEHGKIIEDGSTEQIFEHSTNERLRTFLKTIIF